METLTINIPDDKSSIVKQILKEFGVTIIGTNSQSKILNLSPEQKQEIISSQEQVKNGLFVEQSALDDEVNEWLKK
ncbi:hypothetical protein EZ449_07885 [Pedobacter frigidisoli]|uniref:Uncharacterized protein n=1 Tax=Pedobacter frigidisoli TaxID=2530455 RepID=A0A4V2MMZ7_9SPHI|nr:hypothetical protein [Pedobacter frigidisoli]TCD10798.1 hypothetical protein EZ449_07885 [Pedobacter frigidisoli]